MECPKHFQFDRSDTKCCIAVLNILPTKVKGENGFFVSLNLNDKFFIFYRRRKVKGRKKGGRAHVHDWKTTEQEIDGAVYLTGFPSKISNVIVCNGLLSITFSSSPSSALTTYRVVKYVVVVLMVIRRRRNRFLVPSGCSFSKTSHSYCVCTEKWWWMKREFVYL